MCAYQVENFDVKCFGDCGRGDAFEEPVDISHLYDECDLAAEVMDCNRHVTNTS